MTIALGPHLLQSTLFALIVGLLAICLRRRGAATRHMMWLIAVAKFVLPTTLLALLGSNLAELLPSNHISASVPAVLFRCITAPNHIRALEADKHWRCRSTDSDLVARLRCHVHRVVAPTVGFPEPFGLPSGSAARLVPPIEAAHQIATRSDASVFGFRRRTRAGRIPETRRNDPHGSFREPLFGGTRVSNPA